MRGTIRILIADDHRIVRMGLKTVFALEPDLEVCGEAATAEEALAAWEALRPDVTLLDLRMPGNGLDGLRQLLAREPGAKVLVLTTSEMEEDIHRALRSGARGYLLKGIDPAELAEAIRSVHGGGTWVPEEIARTLSAREECADLSPRELEVLRLLIKGLTNPDICGLLGISLGTVKAHIRNILAKLQVSDRTEAASEAYRRGLID
ncbi:MAG: DNA-binding response regulator [Verrucomicrobia bacterium]|jgi:DNA-binding NarL/FixJ family response regulator|nr:MAG: DNA-binding response regulator [Verrucomicrobiota bacterium]